MEGAGKTLLPGLIDTHVHLAASGGISTDSQDNDFEKNMQRSASALLYSGVTAARSVGDGLDASIKLRKSLADGARLGSQLFICGPMFTAEGGHGTEFVGAPAGRHQGHRQSAVGAYSQNARGSPQAGPRTQSPRSRWHQGDPRSRLGRRHALRPSGPAPGARRCPKRRTRSTCRWPPTPATPATSPMPWRSAAVAWSTAPGATKSPIACWNVWPPTASISTPRSAWQRPTRSSSAVKRTS